MARQLIFTQYGNEAYTRGLNVYTTLNAAEQEAAYAALRRGIMDYEPRQQYRGPEKFVVLPTAAQEVEDAIDDALANHPDNCDVLSAVVLEAWPRKIVAARANGDTLEITGDGLKPAQSGLSDKAAPNIKIRRGAVIRSPARKSCPAGRMLRPSSSRPESRIWSASRVTSSCRTTRSAPSGTGISLPSSQSSPGSMVPSPQYDASPRIGGASESVVVFALPPVVSSISSEVDVEVGSVHVPPVGAEV